MSGYTFPFAVPADLAAATDDELRELLAQVREHATGFSGLPPAETTDDTLAALTACRDTARAVTAEMGARRERVRDAAALAADVLAATDPDADTQPLDPDDDSDDPDADADSEDDPDGGEPDDDGAAAPPAQPARESQPAGAFAGQRRRANPPVRRVAGRAPAAQIPPDAERRTALMTASADVPGFASGQRLETFAQAAAALSARLDQYPTMSAGRASQHHGSRRPITVYDPDAGGRTLVMNHFTRHSAVQFRREFPDDLRVRDGSDGYRVAEHAASERRLPGGSLLESARLAVRNGRSLTAAAGWCAPSDVIYELCELETMDGILDAPELQTSRGGWQIPDDGGPDFSSIYTGIGNAGDTHLTEAEVIADTAKVCTDIPCPDFTDVRLGVDYVCLTGGLLQRRGYPEVVARFGRGAMVALAHKINQGFIAAIVAASGAATVVPADPSGDDAISGLLSAVELAIEDAKYRNRMGFATTLEVVLPHWVLVQMRAAAARRRGVNMVNVSDAEILDWFTTRRAVPRFVYDWQDSYSGLVGGPGAAAALTGLPATVQFLVYPAGTWVKAMQDVVQLDTIYDSTKLATNEYTAVFAEDGWAALKMCALSRLYTANVDPSGVVGCCPSNVS